MSTYVKRIDKLVRDNIPEIILKNGDRCSYSLLENDGVYGVELFRKLQEEIQELIQSNSIEEIADIMEVLRAIMAFYGWTPEEVETERLKKLSTNGGFENRVYLECTEAVKVKVVTQNGKE